MKFILLFSLSFAGLVHAKANYPVKVNKLVRGNLGVVKIIAVETGEPVYNALSLDVSYQCANPGAKLVSKLRFESFCFWGGVEGDGENVIIHYTKADENTEFAAPCTQTQTVVLKMRDLCAK